MIQAPGVLPMLNDKICICLNVLKLAGADLTVSHSVDLLKLLQILDLAKRTCMGQTLKLILAECN
jgi:hypothetical protein